MTVVTTHQKIQYQQYLCCYWPNFDHTLKIVFLEHIEQIPIVKVTFIQEQIVSHTRIQAQGLSEFRHKAPDGNLETRPVRIQTQGLC